MFAAGFISFSTTLQAANRQPLTTACSAPSHRVLFAPTPYPLLTLPLSAVFPQWTVWYPTLYCIFLWSYAGGSGIWVYPALDWSKPLAPLSYLAAGALIFAAFGFT